MAAVALSLGLPAMAQQVFPGPDAAAEALGDAIARSDGDALQRVLGKQYQSLVPQGAIDRDDVYEFLGAWARHHAVQPDGERRALIEVGQSGWTFLVPLAKQKDGWQFDLRAGQQEVRRRRLGRNELVTMETLLQLADAQQRYAEQVGQGRYATQLISAPGKTNGLYWPAASEQDASPIGPDALAVARIRSRRRLLRLPLPDPATGQGQRRQVRPDCMAGPLWRYRRAHLHARQRPRVL